MIRFECYKNILNSILEGVLLLYFVLSFVFKDVFCIFNDKVDYFIIVGDIGLYSF